MTQQSADDLLSQLCQRAYRPSCLVPASCMQLLSPSICYVCAGMMYAPDERMQQIEHCMQRAASRSTKLPMADGVTETATSGILSGCLHSRTAAATCVRKIVWQVHTATPTQAAMGQPSHVKVDLQLIEKMYNNACWTCLSSSWSSCMLHIHGLFSSLGMSDYHCNIAIQSPW